MQNAWQSLLQPNSYRRVLFESLPIRTFIDLSCLESFATSHTTILLMIQHSIVTLPITFSLICNLPFGELQRISCNIQTVGYLLLAPGCTKQIGRNYATRLALANARSKLVEKRIVILRELALLSGMQEDLSHYIIAKYANFFGTVKNQSSRDAIVGRTLTPIRRQIRTLQSAADSINAIIADFDSRSFAIVNIIECIKLGERE